MRNTNEFWGNLEKILYDRRLSERQLCITAGIKPTTLNMSKKRGSYPSVDILCSIADALGCTCDELLNATPDKPVNPLEHGTIRIPFIPQKLSCGHGEEWMSEINQSTVTILDRLASGQPADTLVAANVKGDSMVGASLYDGDMVVFSRGLISGNGIYAIAIDGDVYVKRLAWNPFTRKVTIISENPAYDPITVDADDERLTVLGKVTGWLHTNR